MHSVDNLTGKPQMDKSSIRLCCFIFLSAILLFVLGIKVLKADVFPHYFNPNRHTIVEQDKDTMTIYAWKDSAGNVFTPNDPEVRYFPYGISALIIFLLVAGTGSFSMLTRLHRNGTSEKRQVRTEQVNIRDV